MAIIPRPQRSGPNEAPQRRSQPFPECCSVMMFETQADPLEYSGHEAAVKTMGSRCGSCSEGVLDGKALQTSERAFMALKAEVDDS